jgi:predicted CoA-binding protein
MAQLPTSVERFLEGRRFAVAGVSRTSGQPANAIFRRLTDSGYEAFPVNPKASQVEGVECFSSVVDVPGRLDGVVIATPAAAALDVVRQCAEKRVKHVWMHRSFGEGSVSAEAVAECERLGMQCVEGGCPMMFCEPVDFGHRCMRWWLQRKGRVPR